jgi:hypothetical protein
MGVRFSGRRQGDDGRGSSRGRTGQGGHDTGTRAIRIARVALGDGGRRGVRGFAAASPGHAARPAPPRAAPTAARGTRRGASRRAHAQVQGQNGRYGVYLAPWAVGDDGTQWLDGFETVEDAMAAADRYVAGHLDTSE